MAVDQPRPSSVESLRAPRAVVGALIGAELGAAVGLIFVGNVPLAPLGLVAAGAVAGPLAATGLARARDLLVIRRLRGQLRRAHKPQAARR